MLNWKDGMMKQEQDEDLLQETNPPIKPDRPDADGEEDARLEGDLDEALARFVREMWYRRLRR